MLFSFSCHFATLIRTLCSEKPHIQKPHILGEGDPVRHID